jgi:integrase
VLLVLGQHQLQVPLLFLSTDLGRQTSLRSTGSVVGVRVDVQTRVRAAAISRLTIEDVDANAQTVRLHLGDAPVQLPERVAAMARTVAANRKGHATIGALAPSPWLFPGGQPGRPISTTQLTKRLTQLGIRPNQARSTALFQLATEIPAAILARTLGIHTDVAVAWQRLSAGDWANYAAEVSRRPRKAPVQP